MIVDRKLCFLRINAFSPKREKAPVIQRSRSKNYAPCKFCPQVTENTEADKRHHMNRCHIEKLFKCKRCGDGYKSYSRFEIFEHLRKEHMLDNDEDDLINQEVFIPRDIRRIYCFVCQKDKTKDPAEWCCQRIMDIEPDLQVINKSIIN